MELFLKLVAAGGLGGLISAALQHFLANRRSFLDWHMKERNSSILEFLNAVAVSDRAEAHEVDEKWHRVLIAATKIKLFVSGSSKDAIDNFLKSTAGSDERKEAIVSLWGELGKEANRPPKWF